MAPRKKTAIAPEKKAAAPKAEVPVKAAPLQIAAPRLVSPEEMLVQAIDKGMSVETLERIMQMRKDIVMERAKAAYFEALAGFQHDCPEIKKTKIVRDKNGKIRYRFAPIDSIIRQTKEARFNWGLSHTITAEQTAVAVKATCVVHHKDGWSEATTFEAPIDANAYMTDPQKVASALTFSKRYALSNAYGVVTADEDNDGATATDVEFEVLDAAEGEEERTADDVLQSIEEKVTALPPATAATMLATAKRLWGTHNEKALAALEDSVIRQVITARAGNPKPKEGA
jgi:hypothetical protein